MRKLLFLMTVLSFNLSGQSVQFMHGNCPHNATLSLPSGNGPFPAIVLVPGSGQSDRDGTFHVGNSNNEICLYPGLVGQTLRPYRDLGDQLTAAGFAVLRYDELGISCPTYSDPITFDIAFMAPLSALDYLKTRPDIDANRLILMGHSEGGMLISHMARVRNDIAALVSLGGPRTPLDTVLARQLVELVDSCGGDSAAAHQTASQVLQYFQLVRNQAPGLPPLLGASAAVWYQYISIGDSAAKLFDIANLPTLFVGFQDDFNVPPSELLRYQQETTGDFDFYLLPGLNHNMTPINNHRVPTWVGDTIIQWLLQKNLSETGLNQERATHSKAFPNPFKDLLWIDFLDRDASIKIYSVSGQLVFQIASVQEKSISINTDNWPTGLYVIDVQSEFGATKREKVLKL
jgi:pimeloyl-ACP methyl ester carboxylesterase